MSSYAELEDDIPEQGEPQQQQQQQQEGGAQEEGQQQQQHNPLDDDLFASEDEEQPGPQAEQQAQQQQEEAPQSQADMRARLAALAEKKRSVTEGPQEQDGKKQKKKGKKGGEEGGEGKKRKKKGSGEKGKEGGGRLKKSKRQKQGGEGGAQGDKAQQGGEEEEEEEESADTEVENEGDAGFIDDAGAKEDEHIGSDVGDDNADAPQEPPPEAVEAEELQFGKNKKKKRAQESDSQMQLNVDNMVSLMEGVAEEDMEDHANGRPAINKLKKLAEVDAFMCQRKYHEMFIHAGGLGVLKAWLEPYQDGTLPNVRVRQSVLNACKNLPIDTGREDIRDNLKKSQLGSRIMFLAKCPDETQANRRAALELVQHWSRPIFFDPEAEAEKRRQREHALMKARQQGLQQQRKIEEATAEETQMRAKAKLGQKGFRWHALPPQASKLDYVVEPQHDPALQALAQQGGSGGKKDENRFQKKMNEIQRRQKGTTARAAKPSADGRGVTL